MTEETNNDERVDKALSKFDDLFSGHKRHTDEQIAAVKRELMDALAESKREHDGHTQELKEALDDIKKWQEEQKKAAEKRDDVKDSKSTIVVPPNDVKLPNPPAPATEPSNPTSDAPRKRRLRDYW